LSYENAIDIVEHSFPPLESQIESPHLMELWEHGGIREALDENTL
jgi:hypothetical protein